MSFKDIFKKPGSDWRNLRIEVFDAETNEGIPGALVEVVAENGIDVYHAYSDIHGVANIPNLHKRVSFASITVSGDGFLTKIARYYLKGVNIVHMAVEATPKLIVRPAPHIRGVGWSLYHLCGDRYIDPFNFASILESFGVKFTRAWLIDAWANPTGETGTYDGLLPCRKKNNQFDLYDWNPEYFQRLRALTDELNTVGVVPQYTLFELYSWSKRKEGMLWVPNMDVNLFRNNVNGMYWKEDNVLTDIIPDAWCSHFFRKVIDTLKDTSYVIEIGNEFPEKPLHYKTRDLLRAMNYQGDITVNRQEDTPGQYDNMKIGQDYQGLSLHGRKSLDYLREEFPKEPRFKTFQSFFSGGHYDAKLITLSSDGARSGNLTDINNIYDYPNIEAVALDALSRGFNYEHQSCQKMARFIHGDHSLSNMSPDYKLIESLVNYYNTRAIN